MRDSPYGPARGVRAGSLVRAGREKRDPHATRTVTYADPLGNTAKRSKTVVFNGRGCKPP
jgi:hypothetical protein